MAPTSIARDHARANGFPRYFTGKPCKHGHVVERITANGTCVTCYNATLERYRRENPDHIRETDRLHRRANVEQHRKENREYRLRYRDELLEKDRARTKRPDRQEVLQKCRRNRKARVRGAEGSHTVAQLNELFDKQKRRCPYCRVKLTLKNRHLDHIEPVSRGGSNDISNCQWTCDTCNLRKHAKDPIDFAQENGRLL